MSSNGIILIHDYMWEYGGGGSAAVNEFITENDLRIAPIGDGVSVVIVK
jgi:hypothetical protein